MGKRTTTPEPEKQPTKLTVGKDYFKKQIEQRITLGEEILNRQIQTYIQLEQAKEDYYSWNDYNSELLKQSFNNEHNEYRESYDRVNLSGIFFGGQERDELKELKEDIDGKLGELRKLISKLDLLKTSLLDHALPIEQFKGDNLSQNIFVVHGHNNEIKVEVARTIEKLGLVPIILHEQPNEGKTVIEKFESNTNVGFAIILLTDDDLGKSKSDENLRKRSRQNVIMELGYFIGKLGRSKVCPLYTKDVELPSDISGVMYIEIDGNETWKMKLVKELRAAGYSVDANKIL